MEHNCRRPKHGCQLLVQIKISDFSNEIFYKKFNYWYFEKKICYSETRIIVKLQIKTGRAHIPLFLAP